MPFTELVIPSLIQSTEARDALNNTILPTFKSIVSSAPGLILNVSGHILTKSNVAIPESNFHLVLGIEWEDPKYLYGFTQSKEFQTLGPIMKPYITAPPSPELYETDTSPRDIFASSIADIFKINIRDDSTKEIAAKTAWNELVKKLADAKVLSGFSINLEERLFLGMVGWNGVEQRARALENTTHLKGFLEKLDDVQSFVAQFNAPL